MKKILVSYWFLDAQNKIISQIYYFLATVRDTATKDEINENIFKYFNSSFINQSQYIKFEYTEKITFY